MEGTLVDHFPVGPQSHPVDGVLRPSAHPEPISETGASVPLGLSVLHPVLYRLLCSGSAFGGEYLHPVPGHLGRFFTQRIPDGPGAVYPVDLHLYQPVCLGARAVLWLAMPLWRVAGDGGLVGRETEVPPGESTGKMASAADSIEVPDTSGAGGNGVLFTGTGGEAGGSGTVQNRHHALLRALLAVRRLCRWPAGGGHVHP